MEISVEHDKRTGKSQVVSTARITPDTIHERGLKVYDDGRKSVYALSPSEGSMHNGEAGELSTTEVEEMLRQATERNVPTGVQYHQPVYSAPYTGSSRPTTPRTPNKTPRQTPTPSHSPFQSTVSSRNGAQILREENQRGQDPITQKSKRKTSSSCYIQEDFITEDQKSGEEKYMPDIPRQSKNENNSIPQPGFDAKTQQSLPCSKIHTGSQSAAALVSVKAKSEGMPVPIQSVYGTVGSHSPLLASHKSEVSPDTVIEGSDYFTSCSPFCAESITSLNLVDTVSEEQESGPITMIFMGYENAEDEDEEDTQAELVMIGNSDEDDDQVHFVKSENDREEYLSYHPEGCKSKVFQPKVGIAKVASCRDSTEDAYINWEELGIHKPTFIHKPGKHSP